MRFALVPLVVLVVAGGGYAICRAAGWNPDLPSLLPAALGAIVVGELALVPLLLAGSAPQPVVAQAGLIGTLVHLFGCIVLAAVIILLRRPEGLGFVYWLLAMYWASLAPLVAAFSRAVRSAPLASSATSNTAPAPQPAPRS